MKIWGAKFTLTYAIVFASKLLFAQDTPEWKVLNTLVEPRHASMLGDHNLKITLLNQKTGANYSISTETYADRIVETDIIRDHILILGHSSGPDEALFIDPLARSVQWRAIGYGMKVIGNKWLVSIEWYPNHLFPPQYPNDVVLVKDLTGSGNSCDKAVSNRKISVDSLVRAAGAPVFPSLNGTQCLYQNVQNNNNRVTRVLPNTFAMTSEEQLLFIASDGPDNEFQKEYLVKISLRLEPTVTDRIHIQDLTQVRDEIGIATDHPLEVQSLEPFDKAIRLILKPGYKKHDVVLPNTP